MSKEILLNEIRYAERLCQRTARLYRKLQAAGTFLAVVGGSAMASALTPSLPTWLGVAGAAVFAVFGAAMIAVRPADKAATNEADAKRYTKLRTDAVAMDEDAIRVALNKTREGDVAEVEPLREVAFNDVVREAGREDQVVPLRLLQRVLSAVA
jgi:hypothetical protein